MQDDIVKSFLMLFVVMDSLGNIPIFNSLLEHFDPKSRKEIIGKSVLVATFILMLFSVAGMGIFSYFGIRMSDLRIASGLVLFVLALREFFETKEEHEMSVERITVFPLATPLLAGPGSISTIMVITESLGGPIPALVVILANALVSYVILSNYQVILSRLGKPVTIMTAKVSNLIVAALAVSLVRQGIEEFLALS
ncbi:MAG TPA: MarC family protein [Thermoproteota archaeon]|nr:MarC family protein [Thermoproteota archaeon]